MKKIRLTIADTDKGIGIYLGPVKKQGGLYENHHRILVDGNIRFVTLEQIKTKRKVGV